MTMLKLLRVALPALILAPMSASAGTVIAPTTPSKLSVFSSLGDLPNSASAGHKFAKPIESPDGPTSMPIILVPLASVPEPAAWGLMIAGVGFAGGALRGRRRTALATA